MSAMQLPSELASDYRRRLAEKMAHKFSLIAREPKGRAYALAQARWELVRLLKEYRLFKHRHIFDPTIRTGHASSVALATDLKAKCTALHEEYLTHVLKWSLVGGDTDWAAYEQDLRHIINRITTHLATEGFAINSLQLSTDRC